MRKINSIYLLNDNELKNITGGNNAVNWILADMADAYSNMVYYQHMKPSPINN
ncbi:bacteriocin [Companilactobacillus futsaii]|uniref:Bacteriocin n=2 Tax=Companilactobacillus futsaii TaxID=938155 RepID=A0A5B7T0U4_9LACO|nr:bacteriocin [Companilactobacillus futsaii]KRK97705.1 hypothetical protein FC88_GL001498 [Companilactobacillus futsaii JCM 17355]QCX25657.1 bacteriocin [Companilactobacillus futsaii]